MNERKDICVLGVNFRTAPLHVRECMSFSPEESERFCSELRSQDEISEAAVLSTCNRTEFYFAAADLKAASERAKSLLKTAKPGAPVLRSECRLYDLRGEKAVRHLFEVSCGLDSAILGEVQILRQVKAAYAAACGAGTIGKYLNRAFIRAIRLGKVVRSETEIGWGSASIGSALAGRLKQSFLARGDARREILLIGAGEIARDIAHHLSKCGTGRITFLNRTDEKARDLARNFRGWPGKWAELESELIRSDVAIVATSATQPVLSREMLIRVAAARERALVLIDAGMPRNVECGSPVEVIDIDGIREEQKEVASRRQGAVSKVQLMIDDEARAHESWVGSQDLESAISALYREMSEQVRSAAQELSGRANCASSEAEMLLSRSFRQILHPHVQRLRDLGCGRK